MAPIYFSHPTYDHVAVADVARVSEVMQSKTFIIGAGASTEFGPTGAMPIGTALANIIQQMAESNFESPNSDSSTIVSAIAMNEGFGDAHNQALRRLRDSVASKDSIDDFVNEWCHVMHLERVAKLAIAQAIVDAEGRTFLASAGQTGASPAAMMNLMRGTWLDRIVRYTNPAIQRARLSDALASCTFITFNYDRCIETYLYEYLSAGMGLSHEDAANAVRRIRIVHVYGLPDQIPSLGGRTEFGSVEARGLSHAAAGIRTYCETIDSKAQWEIRDIVYNSDVLVFLGCAFHQQNLSILFPDGMPKTKVFGTILGMRDARTARLETFLSGRDETSRNLVRLHQMTCAQLIDQYHDDLFEHH